MKIICSDSEIDSCLGRVKERFRDKEFTLPGLRAFLRETKSSNKASLLTRIVLAILLRNGELCTKEEEDGRWFYFE